jgi:hypothetical protein
MLLMREGSGETDNNNIMSALRQHGAVADLVLYSCHAVDEASACRAEEGGSGRASKHASAGSRRNRQVHTQGLKLNAGKVREFSSLQQCDLPKEA